MAHPVAKAALSMAQLSPSLFIHLSILTFFIHRDDRILLIYFEFRTKIFHSEILAGLSSCYCYIGWLSDVFLQVTSLYYVPSPDLKYRLHIFRKILFRYNYNFSSLACNFSKDLHQPDPVGTVTNSFF